jgi:hypothetical protein
MTYRSPLATELCCAPTCIGQLARVHFRCCCVPTPTARTTSPKRSAAEAIRCRSSPRVAATAQSPVFQPHRLGGTGSGVVDRTRPEGRAPEIHTGRGQYEEAIARRVVAVTDIHAHGPSIRCRHWTRAVRCCPARSCRSTSHRGRRRRCSGPASSCASSSPVGGCGRVTHSPASFPPPTNLGRERSARCAGGRNTLPGCSFR